MTVESNIATSVGPLINDSVYIRAVETHLKKNLKNLKS